MKRWLLSAHPLFAAAAPILLLAHANRSETEFSVVWPPLAISVCAAALLCSLQWAIRRDWEKAAISTSVLVAFFFSYGHLLNLIQGLGFIESRTGQRVLAIAPWLPLFLLVELQLRRSGEVIHRISNGLAVMAMMLCLIPGLQFAGQSLSGAAEKPALLHTQVDLTRRPDPLPDIYYIVLDGYARNDTLREYYELDNSEFTDYLEGCGFFVGEDSHSNYTVTELSMASSLNMQHLGEVANTFRGSKKPINKLVQNNDIGRILKSQGYRYIHLRTEYPVTHHSDIADEAYPRAVPTFHDELAKTTMLRTLWKRQWRKRAPALVLRQFDKLREIPANPEPTFTLAHIVSPHPPYWFNRDGDTALRSTGSGADVWTSVNDYREQLLFVNTKVREAVDTILAQSASPPIIIIQADHGTVMPRVDKPLDQQAELVRYRHRILYAVNAPQACRGALYSSITPVNTFRVILNEVFGADLPLLADRTYYSPSSNLAEFTEVTHLLRDDGHRVAKEGTPSQIRR